MAKIAAKQMKVGLEFEVTKDPAEKDAYNVFGYDPNKVRPTAIILNEDETPAIGSRLIVTQIPKAPYKKVYWKYKDGDGTEYYSFWDTFRKSTDLISTDVEPIKKLAITSNGQFNGFDVEINNIDYYFYNYSGYGEMKIYFKFVGEFEGGKRINTKIINKIKSAPGFKEYMLKLISDKLDSEPTVDDYISQINYKTRDWQHDYKRKMATWYSGGKLEFKIKLMDDKDQIKQDVAVMLDKFIKVNSTMCHWGRDY